MIDVLVVEDDDSLREAIGAMLTLQGICYQAVENGRAAEGYLGDKTVALVLSDVQMTPGNGYELLTWMRKNQIDTPVILMTAYGSIPQAVNAIQAGAVDYLVKPFEVSHLITVLKRHLHPPHAEISGLVAVDPLSVEALKLVNKVALADVSVLLNGESGVGKEVYSRYIHQRSGRSQQPFVAVNCAAIPESLLEATLFGAEKGAFTGAIKSTMGKFEQAQGGTLLLDEVTEIALGLQAKLLRVLQEKEVERLGGRKTVALDVRIIATSNRHLKTEVREKRFREDLYYRLNVFPITIAPLRQRCQDIVPLAEKIIARYSRAQGQSIELSESAADLLRRHPWPGNVRELDNVLQRALILKQGNYIEAGNIMLEPSSDAEIDDLGPLHSDLRDRETEVIIDTLRGFKGSRKKTAEKLGISPRTLRYKLARLRDQGAEVPRQGWQNCGSSS